MSQRLELTRNQEIEFLMQLKRLMPREPPLSTPRITWKKRNPFATG